MAEDGQPKPRRNWPLRICFVFMIGSLIRAEWIWAAGLFILWVLMFSVSLAKKAERDADVAEKNAPMRPGGSGMKAP